MCGFFYQSVTEVLTVLECIVEAGEDDWVDCAVRVRKERGDVVEHLVPVGQLLEQCKGQVL